MHTLAWVRTVTVCVAPLIAFHGRARSLALRPALSAPHAAKQPALRGICAGGRHGIIAGIAYRQTHGIRFFSRADTKSRRRGCELAGSHGLCWCCESGVVLPCRARSNLAARLNVVAFVNPHRYLDEDAVTS